MQEYKFSVRLYYSYNDLPEEFKAVEGPPYSTYNYQNYIAIQWPNGRREVYSDNMEPEDATFGRDLSWIVPAIGQAYNTGVAIGISSYA